MSAAVISLNVRFYLNSDTAMYDDPTDYLSLFSVDPANVKGLLEITYPDGIVESFEDINNAPLTPSTTFSNPLRLDADGKEMTGTYKFKYSAYDGSSLIQTKTFTIDFQYVAPTGEIGTDFDVFTPQLKVTDDTTYTVSGYNTPTISLRTLKAASDPVTVETSTAELIINPAHATTYTLTLSTTLDYTHSTSTWFSVLDTITASSSKTATKPLMLPEILALINCLDAKRTALANCNDATYAKMTEDYQTLMSLYTNFINNGQAGITTGQTDRLTEMLNLLTKWNCTDDGTIASTALTAYTWCLCASASGSGARVTYDAGNGAEVTADATGIIFAMASGVGTFSGSAELLGGTIRGVNSDASYDRNGATNSFKLTIPVKTANVGYATLLAALCQVYDTTNNASISDSAPLSKDEGAVATRIVDISSNSISLVFDSIGSIYTNWAITFIIP